MCGSWKDLYFKVIGNYEGEKGGSQKQKFFKEKQDVELESGGLKPKYLPWEGYGYFSVTQ